MRIIYMDNQKTTKIDEKVLEAMMPYLKEKYGIPMGEFGHRFEEEALEAIEVARELLAKSINANPEEIVFTFSDIDSDNIAIKGKALTLKDRKVIIASKIERKSILDSLKFLGDLGYKYKLVEVDEEGFIKLEEIDHIAAKGAGLIATHVGNHEIGTIQDVRALGDISEDRNVHLHLDASHAFLKVPIDVEKLKVDTMTLSSHLIHGPKGISALFVREGVKLKPIITGGLREKGLSPGEPSVANIVGFGKAVEIWDWNDVRKIRKLRDLLIEKLLSEIPETYLNGPRGDKRLPNNVNVSFMKVEGESILLQADARGLIVSTGSACYSQELEPSYVIMAIRGKYEFAHGSIRLSLSRYNTEKDVLDAVSILKEVVENLRKISPL
ncbi:MAG: cysteine desulfurase NifS [Thermoplasmata archaeon]|nr:MAG: cysteine desulfurase NifS [Thermoplasmata archaeon]